MWENLKMLLESIGASPRLFHKTLVRISKKLEPDALPCMPVITQEMKLEAVKAAATKKKGGDDLATRKGSNKTYLKDVAKNEINKAVSKNAEDAFKNNEGFLMVHTPISINKALKNDKAKAALEAE